MTEKKYKGFKNSSKCWICKTHYKKRCQNKTSLSHFWKIYFLQNIFSAKPYFYISSPIFQLNFLGLNCLKSRRAFRCFCLFLKIASTGLTTYLFNLIPNSAHGSHIRNTGNNIPTYHCRTDTFKHSFFPGSIFIMKKKIHTETRNTFFQFIENIY